MHDELTKQDIRLMQQELEDRIQNQRPVLLEEVKRCREFGDLSENFEYKEAKRAKNRNESRIRYLQNTIKTADLIDEAPKQSSVVGLFDKVVLYFEEDEMEQTIQVVTTIRTDPDQGLISKESPWARPSSAARVWRQGRGPGQPPVSLRRSHPHHHAGGGRRLRPDFTLLTAGKSGAS